MKLSFDRIKKYYDDFIESNGREPMLKEMTEKFGNKIKSAL